MKQISLWDYFTNKPHTQEQRANAVKMLALVNGLLLEAQEVGKIRLENNPATGCLISGQTEGGFRLGTSTTGKPASAHRDARAVDICDPANLLDGWIDRKILIRHNLYREAAPKTLSWCHLTDRAPKSGNRSFLP